MLFCIFLLLNKCFCMYKGLLYCSLGFALDSVSMTVPCPLDKIARLQPMCRNIMGDDSVTVHDAECFLGTVEFVCSVTPLCTLHYRTFQKQLPMQVVHLSKDLCISCLVDFHAELAANTSTPLWELDPSIEFRQLLAWSIGYQLSGGGTRSNVLSQEALLLHEQAVSWDFTL